MCRQGVTEFSNNKTSRRVTQPNGIPLLICFVVLLVWAVFGRWVRPGRSGGVGQQAVWSTKYQQVAQPDLMRLARVDMAVTKGLTP